MSEDEDRPTEVTEHALEAREHRSRWLAALRGDDYAQGRGALRDHDGNFCCLGVVEDLRGARWRRFPTGTQSYYLEDQDRPSMIEASTLTTAGCAWLGVTQPDPVVCVDLSRFDEDRDRRFQPATLTGLNDNYGLTFADIADVVADQPDDWIGDPETVRRHCVERNRREGLGTEDAP